MTEQTNQTNKQTKRSKKQTDLLLLSQQILLFVWVVLVSALGNFYSVRVNPTRVSSHTSIQTSEFIELRVWQSSWRKKRRRQFVLVFSINFCDEQLVMLRVLEEYECFDKKQGQRLVSKEQH